MVKHVLKDGKLIPIGGEPSTSELRGTSTYAPRVRTNNSYFTNIPNVTDIVVNPGHRPYKCDICEYSVNDLIFRQIYISDTHITMLFIYYL